MFVPGSRRKLCRFQSTSLRCPPSLGGQSCLVCTLRCFPMTHQKVRVGRRAPLPLARPPSTITQPPTPRSESMPVVAAHRPPPTPHHRRLSRWRARTPAPPAITTTLPLPTLRSACTSRRPPPTVTATTNWLSAGGRADAGRLSLPPRPSLGRWMRGVTTRRLPNTTTDFLAANSGAPALALAHSQESAANVVAAIADSAALSLPSRPLRLLQSPATSATVANVVPGFAEIVARRPH